MRINEIDLSDWCQIERRSINCSGHSLIGFIGSNGTGKSNALAAIKFLITGEVDDKLEDYVRFTASSTSVSMKFDVDTTSVDVRRTIAADGKSEAWMKLTDDKYGVDETFKKTSDVNDALERLLNIDRDLARNNIFVRQKHLDDILFTTPAKRERAWQRLCGLGDAEKIHTYLGTVLADIPEVADYTSQILECKQNIENLGKQIEGRADELSTLREKLVKTGNPARILEVQGKLNKCADARDKLVELLQRKTSADENVQKAISELAAAKGRIVKLATDNECDETALSMVIQERITTVDNILRAIAEAAALQKSMSDTAESIATSKLKLKALEEEDMSQVEAAVKSIEDTLKGIRDSQAKAGATIDLYQSLRTSMYKAGEAAECPLCASPIKDTASLIKRCDNILLDNQTRVSELLKEMQENDDLLREGTGLLKGHEAKIAQLRASINSMESTYLQQNQRVSDMDVDGYDKTYLEGVKAELEGVREEARSLRQSVSNMEADMARLNIAQNQANVDYNDAKKVADEFAGDIDPRSQADALCKVYDEAQAAQNLLNELEGANRADEANLKNWKASLERMEKMTMTGTTDCRVRNSVERIRNWFHYSQGPHKVTMAVLRELTGGVNEFLAILDGRFYVVPDEENLMFRVVFTDGRVQPEEPLPATRLSGGEKASLAVAFRLASYYMFSGSLGIICLDEPTEYLDARKIEAFGRFIEKLKEISTSLGLQIFMATHHVNIVPLFDSVERMDK